MKKWVKFSFILVLTLILLGYFDFEPPFITTRASSGNVGIFVEGPGLPIYILSPENTTYNFNVGSPTILQLNVSSSSNIQNWWYKLEDLRHNLVIYDNVSFVPNSTISAVRWDNKLTIYGNDSFGSLGSASVIFHVNVPNVAPVLKNISNQYVCEGSFLSTFFNASDPDEDNLTFSISPQNPFFLFPTFFIRQTNVSVELFSGTLSKSHVGINGENISVTDGLYVDSRKINITVIEINNPPALSDVGVQTIWNVGENRTLLKQVIVNDIESGNSTSGNFSFNLTFLSGQTLFNVTSLGLLNFTANSSTTLGTYNLSICVTDRALSVISSNISLCNQNGLNQTVCNNFSLTVTNNNRAPYFVNWYPLPFNLSVSGETLLMFNITKADPDSTVPDAYWYLDGSFLQYNSLSSRDYFNYTFACGISGNHSLVVEITDGLLNSSLQWNMSVAPVDCPVTSSGSSGGGGGGGGGGPAICREKWICGIWEFCQSNEDSFKTGSILESDYLSFKNSCDALGLSSDICGFQVRSCIDLAKCGTKLSKPLEIQTCSYTFFPSCFDSIKNCHNGDCEVLTDCGGPCNACATCSDGVKNQAEQDVDCGGPCPNRCSIKGPFVQKEELKYLIYLLIILIIIVLIVIIVIKVIKILQIKREIKELAWYRL